MIIETHKKPSVFNRIPDNSRWFRMVVESTGDIYGWLALQDERPAIGVHLEVLFFTPTVMKQMLEDWQSVVVEAKSMDATTLYATNFDFEDKRWPRFIHYFGFPKPVTLAFSQQEV